MNTARLPERPAGSESHPYYQTISRLQDDFPHLEALLLYKDAIEKARQQATVGSQDSDSILVAELPFIGSPRFYQINAYDPDDIKKHEEILSGKGDHHQLKSRLLLVEDLSPGAIEAIGAGFNLDPHVFYFHLGFDVRRSAMLNFANSQMEKRIPVQWYFPNHGPEDFVSVPLPCDLKPPPSDTPRETGDIPVDRTYARQAYRPIAQLDGEYEPAARRGFHRISLAFTQTQIKTTIVLAFPTWKRMSRDESSTVLDSFAYPLVPPAMPLHLINATIRPEREGFPKPENGRWSDGQWERIQPLFNTLLPKHISRIHNHDLIRERALLWVYSKVSWNYHIASQSDSHSWRDARTLHQSGQIGGHVAQPAKKFLRDNMTKNTELLEIAKMTLDQALEDAADRAAVEKWQRKVNVLVMYQRSRIDMILKSIEDGESFL